jgi:hypothetical protein
MLPVISQGETLRNGLPSRLDEPFFYTHNPVLDVKNVLLYYIFEIIHTGPLHL